MCAKVLVPASDQTEVGSLARLDRLERRIGVEGAAATVTGAASPAQATPVQTAAPAASPALAAVTTAKFQAAWEDILNAVQAQSRIVWSVAFALEVIDFTDGVLTLRFGSNADLESFKKQAGAPDTLRNAIRQVLGVEVKFKPLIAEASVSRASQVPVATPPISSAAANAAAVAAGITPPAPAQKTVNQAAAKPAAKPVAKPVAKPSTKTTTEPATTPAAVTEPIETMAAAANPVEEPAPLDDARYGESVVREFGGVPIDDPKSGR